MVLVLRLSGLVGGGGTMRNVIREMIYNVCSRWTLTILQPNLTHHFSVKTFLLRSAPAGDVVPVSIKM